MKIKLLLVLLLIPAFIQAQTNYSSFIMGDGVRIRSNGSAKGTEVSKVHGKREVSILEESNKRDALGGKDVCESYPWVKVKWEGDSTGWVYGKYNYYFEANESFVKPDLEFTYQNTTYKVLTYRTNSMPMDDENGPTGCGLGYALVFYNAAKNIYYPVQDVKSKENKTIMTLWLDGDGGEQLNSIWIDNKNIMVNVDYFLQDGGGNCLYTIQYSAGKFTVVDYKKTKNND